MEQQQKAAEAMRAFVGEVASIDTTLVFAIEKASGASLRYRVTSQYYSQLILYKNNASGLV